MIVSSMSATEKRQHVYKAKAICSLNKRDKQIIIPRLDKGSKVTNLGFDDLASTSNRTPTYLRYTQEQRQDP